MSSLSELANAIRILSVDAVEKAKSGHPGMPLGMADIAAVLWKKFMRHSPANPAWFNRDRFVLSNGHGSMLLYALLHLNGYKLSMEDIKQFRQLNSKTPGHPEYDHCPGVETSTGPLGQGLANAVGMALSEKVLAAQFNREKAFLVDHYTYAFAGDGCLMEGISHEVCSLAGTLKLGKLIVFYDDNGISIDGKVSQWFTDDTPKRFEAYDWQVIDAVDGHDYEAIEKAIEKARANKAQPTLIICKTNIGYGSAKVGHESSHGAPLGAEDIAHVRAFFKWPYPPFEIPESIYEAWDNRQQGHAQEQAWLELTQDYQQRYPVEYASFLRRINGDLPDNWPEQSADFIAGCLKQEDAVATRKASQLCLNFYAAQLPELFGGSADLTGSNNTNWKGSLAINNGDFSGNYLYYGVREFAMAAIMNGMALHGGFIPYGGTFLVFADYAKNAIRLSALMRQRVIYVFTHDSIGLGEDGPTHQPIEQAAMLRMMPDMQVWRPADLVETAIAWQQAISSHNAPTSLLLSRQSLPQLPHHEAQIAEIKKGAYILKESEGRPEAIIIATGSEVHLALEAAAQLNQAGRQVRVVSMPCAEIFLAEDKEWQDHVLAPDIKKRVAIEAGATAYWYQFTGLDGAVIGIDRYGVSAPASDAYRYFDITVERIIKEVQNLF